ncbi:MAG: hypothetical protein ABIS01_16940, partial [Ferruginibacter sp.]
DLCALVDYELHNFDRINGHTFNAGGGLVSSVSLNELTSICATVTGNKVKEQVVEENRKGDIPIYITDNTRINHHIGWSPQKNITEIVEDIFQWINKNEKQLAQILNV